MIDFYGKWPIKSIDVGMDTAIETLQKWSNNNAEIEKQTIDSFDLKEF